MPQVETHNLIPSDQFGFRSGHDTTTQLVRVIEATTLQCKGHNILKY